MIDEKDKKIILEMADKYRISKVLLFGSSLSQNVDARDIDIAIEGIADEDYFSFYGELMCALAKPVDVIDLSKKSKFVDIILREGIRIDA
jgi:uncharacterized protein